MAGRVRVGLVRVDQVRWHPHNVRHDLGDLRGLARSIHRYGLLQPVVAEEYAGLLRLRAGHRRIAAARLAGLFRVPAVIHSEALDDVAWLGQAVQENVQRRQLAATEKRRTAEALRELGCSWREIGETFGVSARTVAGWVIDQPDRTTTPGTPRARATKRLIAAHRSEFTQLVTQERARTAETVEQQDSPAQGQPSGWEVAA
jgi:ParB/RepB/Spo0J family partition protein